MLLRTKLLRRLGYLQWLASSQGPQEAVFLKRFKPPPLVLQTLRLRHAFSRRVPRCRETDALFLIPPHAVKVAALRRYARQHGLKNFIETGTYLGDTTAALAPMFSHCVTIEIAPALHERACARLKRFENVRCVLGDSAVTLPEIIARIGAPALFWLDGHASGGETFGGGNDPLFSELRAIYSSGMEGNVVLIDDARGHDIPAIRRLCELHAHIEVRNDIVRLTPIR